MNIATKITSLLVATALVCVVQTTAFATTIFDDFDDNSLNGAIWTQAGGSGAFLESGTTVRFASTPLRDTLATNATFNPSTNPVTVSGEFTIGGQTDGWFYVMTQTSGVTDGTINGFVHDALSVAFNWREDRLEVFRMQSKSGTNLTTTANGSLIGDPGDVYSFTVTDDGSTISGTFTEVSGAQAGSSLNISVAGYSFSPGATSDLVGFTHREGRQAFLDFVNITDESATTAPEPSSLLLAMLSFVGLAMSRRRGRRDA